MDDEFKHHVDQVEAKLAMSEFDFPSSLPIIGPVVRAIRMFWNNISTRWYVQHYVQQQAKLDLAMLRTLRMAQYRHEQFAAQLDQLSARLDKQTQQTAFARELLERDIEAIVLRMQRTEHERKPENG